MQTFKINTFYCNFCKNWSVFKEGERLHCTKCNITEIEDLKKQIQSLQAKLNTLEETIKLIQKSLNVNKRVDYL